MKLSLHVKLTGSFLVVTLVVFVIIGLTANVLLEKQFKEYVIEGLEKKNSDYIDLIASRYSDWGGTWNPVGIENIGMNALAEGYMLRVKDVNGNIIWGCARAQQRRLHDDARTDGAKHAAIPARL